MKEKINELQLKIIRVRAYLLKDNDDELSYFSRSEILKILGDKENE